MFFIDIVFQVLFDSQADPSLNIHQYGKIWLSFQAAKLNRKFLAEMFDSEILQQNIYRFLNSMW